MHLVARLTWQSREPAVLAADLERRLGAPTPPDLELVPWLRESATDAPMAAGRLVFEPVEEGVTLPPPAAGTLELVGVAWATVELDRAETELASWLALAAGPDTVIEPHLGARVRARRTSALPGGHLVLAEPLTEGRLAASLARDGEGPCAVYLRPADGGLDAWLDGAMTRGVAVSPAAAGPFGRSMLVAGIAVAGPHVIVVEAREPSFRILAPSTIAP